jgi:two-component sensor histidine kinase
VILPIAVQGRGGMPGLLMVGCNPYRPYDDSYQGFLMLVANQIAAAVTNIRAYEEEVTRVRALSDLDKARSEFAETLREQAALLEAELARRREIESHQKLLLDELNHRVKNTLATVQAVAMQTLRGEDTSHRDTFLARLFALSGQHDLLTRDNWEGANLKDVVLRALKPYDELQDGRCTVEGPDIRLTPKRALALGMAFHELATNAAKHGALSTESGSVTVSWWMEPESGCLKLRWQEDGGPRVAVPDRNGFGRRLIERGLSHELSAHVRLQFPPSGVICEWEMSPPQTQHEPAPIPG